MKNESASPADDKRSSRRPVDAWSKAARRLLKAEMKRHDFTYAELAALLKRDGDYATADSLMTRVNRGTFTFAFFIQVVTAMGGDAVHLAHLRRARDEKERREK